MYRNKCGAVLLLPSTMTNTRQFHLRTLASLLEVVWISYKSGVLGIIVCVLRCQRRCNDFYDFVGCFLTPKGTRLKATWDVLLAGRREETSAFYDFPPNALLRLRHYLEEGVSTTTDLSHCNKAALKSMMAGTNMSTTRQM